MCARALWGEAGRHHFCVELLLGAEPCADGRTPLCRTLIRRLLRASHAARRRRELPVYDPMWLHLRARESGGDGCTSWHVTPHIFSFVLAQVSLTNLRVKCARACVRARVCMCVAARAWGRDRYRTRSAWNQNQRQYPSRRNHSGRRARFMYRSHVRLPAELVARLRRRRMVVLGSSARR